MPETPINASFLQGGTPDEWSHSLETALRIVRQSPVPMCLYHGLSFTAFPNTAYEKWAKGAEATHKTGLAHIAALLNSETHTVFCDSNWENISPERPAGGDCYAFYVLPDAAGNPEAIMATYEVADASVQLPEPPMATTAILEQMPVGITILSGPTFIAEMANSQYLQIVDRTRASFLGRSLFDSLPEVREAVEPLLRSVLETGEPYLGTEFPVFLNRYGNQEQTYFNFIYNPRRNANGEIDGIIVVATEVTDIVKAKQFIEESGRQFTNLIMQSPVAMTIFKGPEFVIEMANTKLIRDIWRLPEEAVMGKKALEVFPELNDQKFPELLRSVLKTGIAHQEIEAMAYVQGGDGMRQFYLDYEYAPLFDVEGGIAGVMITVNDTTERVLARQKLEKSESMFRQLADSMPQFVWSGGSDGVLDYFNHSVFDYTGLTAEECMNGNWIQIVHPDDREANIAAWQQAVQTGSDFLFEHRFRKHDGTYRWQLSRAVALRDAAGAIHTWVGTSTDIHAHKEFAQELEKQVQERTSELQKINADLEKMNRELQSFAYISSHDLQEPLRKIQMFSGRILDLDHASLSESSRHYFSRMNNVANRMQLLLDDLLVYSRTSASDKHWELLDVAALANDVSADLEEEIAQKNAVVRLSGLGKMRVVAFQFRQLFYNLISNSLKFAKADTPPEITVHGEIVAGATVEGAAAEKNYWHICVADNGIGFEQQYSEKIFDFFQRLNDREAFTGTGMGLAIVRRIVENHDGIVHATGKPGEGTTFDFWFPIER